MVELIWESRGRIVAIIDGREVTIPGETFLEHDPDYVIYAKYLKLWGDGTPIAEDEKSSILTDVLGEAERRGWKFEVEG